MEAENEQVKKYAVPELCEADILKYSKLLFNCLVVL